MVSSGRELQKQVTAVECASTSKSVSRSSGHRNKWTESDDYDTSAKDSPKETTNVLEQNEEENGSPSSTKEEQPDSCDLSISQLKFLYTKVPVVDCDFIPFAVVKLFNGANFPAETLERKFRKRYSIEYKWFRLCWKYPCACPDCSLPSTIEFVSYSDLSREKEQQGVENVTTPKPITFCSKDCFRKMWPQLRRIFLGDELSHTCERNKLQPKEFYWETIINGREPLENEWYTKPVGWTRKYIPTIEDIGHCLRLEFCCKALNEKGQVITSPCKTIDSKPVICADRETYERKFLSLIYSKWISLNERNSSSSFRVLSYNCLAEIYTSESLHSHCPDWALAWTYRRRNLLNELTRYNVDIMCLQEIQADHYEDYLKPALSRLGYDGVYKAKSREAMGQKGKMDGCATCWKRNLFHLREQFVIDFNAVACLRHFAHPQALNRLLKGNIALVTILDFVDGSGSICLVNIHIYWDPEQTDVKLFQVDVLLEELEISLSQMGPNIPLIIAGDFNSTPDSTVYELISTGTVSGERDDITKDPLGLIGNLRLRHGLALQSAYSVVGNEPKYTNYTENFVGVLDYIWYNPSQLIATALLDIPSEDELVTSNESSLPNRKWSSDHIALMAEFRRIESEDYF